MACWLGCLPAQPLCIVRQEASMQGSSSGELNWVYMVCSCGTCWQWLASWLSPHPYTHPLYQVMPKYDCFYRYFIYLTVSLSVFRFNRYKRDISKIISVLAVFLQLKMVTLKSVFMMSNLYVGLNKLSQNPVVNNKKEPWQS